MINPQQYLLDSKGLPYLGYGNYRKYCNRRADKRTKGWTLGWTGFNLHYFDPSGTGCIKRERYNICY